MNREVYLHQISMNKYGMHMGMNTNIVEHSSGQCNRREDNGTAHPPEPREIRVENLVAYHLSLTCSIMLLLHP